MFSIDTRIAALADAFQWNRPRQWTTYPGSLFAFRQELATLDEAGKTQLLDVLTNPDDGESDNLNLTMQEIKHFIADYGRKD